MPLLVAIMGPTASGKSDLAERLAERLEAQLLNADAFQVYRGLDIGTAKPRDRDRYALLDLKDPRDPYGVGAYVQDAGDILNSLYDAGRNAVMVGGTGLYIRAVLEEYRDLAPAPDPALRDALSSQTLEERVDKLLKVAPEAAARIDLRNPARVQRALERALAPRTPMTRSLPPFARRKFAIIPPADENIKRIEARVDDMIRRGWASEVAGLRAAGYELSDPGLRAIGYRPLWRHLVGELEFEEARATTIAETGRYAKRQRTWLRSEPGLTLLDWRDPFPDACLHLNL